MATRNPATPPVTGPPLALPRIVPHLIYENVADAVEWLTEAFGFKERTWARHTLPDGVLGRTQLEVADGVITIGTPSIHGVSPRHGVSCMLYVYLDDVIAHYQRARAAGAAIVLELEDQAWGDRRYQAADPEGHQWTFAHHVSDAQAVEHH